MGMFIKKLREGGALVSKSNDYSEPPPARHHFASKWVVREAATGFVSFSQGKLVIHADPDIEYDLERGPGAYCVHCGEKLADGPAASEAEALKRNQHVDSCEIANNPDDTDDPSNPVGVEVIDYYDGVLANG